MNENLLHEFLAEDCDQQFRIRFLEIIHDPPIVDKPKYQNYTFNRFTVLLDFEFKQAVIRDDLTPGAEGEYTLSFGKFAEALV